jgi:hypothetical protein
MKTYFQLFEATKFPAYKVGDEVREYFYCDNMKTLETIKHSMIDGFMN